MTAHADLNSFYLNEAIINMQQLQRYYENEYREYENKKLQTQREYEDKKFKTQAIIENWCASPQIQRELIKHYNISIGERSDLKEIKNIKVYSTVLALINWDRPNSFQISCKSDIFYKDGSIGYDILFGGSLNSGNL